MNPLLSIFPAHDDGEKVPVCHTGGRTIRAGDLIGFSACDWSGVMANLGTWGIPFFGLSHVAIAAPDPDEPHRLLLYESTTLSDRPCAIQGIPVRGVQAHMIPERLLAYVKNCGRVYHYPLLRPLDRDQRAWLTELAVRQLDKSYDYLGAFRARDLPLGLLHRAIFGEAELATLFCSEFVAWLWNNLRLGYFRNPSAWSPNRLGRHAVRHEITGRPVRMYRRRPRIHDIRLAASKWEMAT